jgi:hypothetical protein
MVASCRCRVFRPPPDTLTTVGTVWSGSIVSMFDSVPDSPDLDAYAKLKITSPKLSWYWGSKPKPCLRRHRENKPDPLGVRRYCPPCVLIPGGESNPPSVTLTIGATLMYLDRDTQRGKPMKRLIFPLIVMMSVLGGVIGCSSGSSSSAATTTCWQTGTGLVIKTVSTVSGCTAVYADGQPVVTGPVSGLGTPTCTYSFPSGITWWVWDTDNGASGNAEALCTTLQGE